MTLGKWQVQIALWLLLAACGVGNDLDSVPKLPEVKVDDFLPAIEQQIIEAQQQALANPKNAGASGHLGMVLSTYGLLDAARICYIRANRLDPSEFRWLYYLGIAYSDLGQSDQAMDSFRQALEKRPNDTWTQLRLADLLLANGHRSESRTLYQRVARLNPSLFEAHLGLAELANRANNPRQAAQYFRRAIEINPQLAAAHYGLARALSTLGKTTEADLHFSQFEKLKGVRMQSTDPLVMQVPALNLSDTHLVAKGRYYLQQGRISKAVSEFEKAIVTNPENTSARLGLLEGYGRLGSLGKAKTNYEHAAELDPTNPMPHKLWGAIQKRELDYAAAADTFALAANLDSSDTDTLLSLGFVSEKLARVEEARTHYRQALTIDPNSRDAHYFLGLSLAADKSVEASDHLTQVIEPDDESTAWALIALAGIYHETGRLDEAGQALERAYKLAMVSTDLHLLASVKPNPRYLLDQTSAPTE